METRVRTSTRTPGQAFPFLALGKIGGQSMLDKGALGKQLVQKLQRGCLGPLFGQ
jgi:hypothetical protein